VRPAPSADSRPTGKQLLSASWSLLCQDRELLWLPVLAAVTGLLVAGILFVPGFVLGRTFGGRNDALGGWVGGVLAAFALSVVAVYFQAALVMAANQRADGGEPTLRGALHAAWTKRGPILKWAVVTTTVGVVIRAIEERLGVLGKIVGLLGGVAWAIASFLVVPVLVAEDLGPIAGVKRSAQLIREHWGTSLRTTLRFGVMQILMALPAVVVIIIGGGVLANGTSAGVVVGVLLLSIGLLALVGLSLVFSAITSYARAMIYRYATGQPVPGIDPHLFTGVFRQKRSRRRLA
jgi:hypothetical protein